MEISDADFIDLWKEISEALLRIAHSISSAKKDECEKTIDKFLYEPLTPDANQSEAELQFWYKKDMDTKGEVEKLRNEMERMKVRQEQMITILVSVESHTSRGTSCSPSQPNVPQLLEARECVVPILTEQPEAEDAAVGPCCELQTNQALDPSAELDIWKVIFSFKKSLDLLLEYLRTKLGVNVQDSRLGSLIVTVSCTSLEVLERLWDDYCNGHLNEVVQETLVTEELLKKLCLSEVKLKTVISEEAYKAYKELLTHRSGKTSVTV